LHLTVNEGDIKGALSWAEDHLRQARVDSSRLNAQLLLSHVTGYSRTELLMHHDQNLPEARLTSYRELVRKRASGFPLQYILGRCDFYNVTLKVAPGVFIPRPETEILVEEVLAFFKGRAEVSLLEIGTGSGAIAVALAKNLPSPEIVATDVSAFALRVAKENAVTNGVQDAVLLTASDLFEGLKLGDDIDRRFDGIVSNPPYIPRSERESLPREVRDFEPPEALFAEEEGLFFHRRIVESAPGYLKPAGVLALEVALGQADEVRRLLESQASFGSVRVREDLTGTKRVVCSVRK
jgi:release factor glutamine methyltransferase